MTPTSHVQFLRRGQSCWAMLGIVFCHLEQARKGVDSAPLFKALR